MKTRVGIAILAVMVLIGSVAAGSRREPKYSFRIQPGAKSVQLVCERGCAWKTLTAECKKAPCSFRVDEFGVK